MTNKNYLSWFINAVTGYFRMSRCRSLLMYGNPKGCVIAEHIATKVEVNPQMLSTLKNGKSILSLNPGGYFETYMVQTLVILFALVKRQIGKVYSKSGVFWGIPLMSPFLEIFLILLINT